MPTRCALVVLVCRAVGRVRRPAAQDTLDPAQVGARDGAGVSVRVRIGLRLREVLRLRLGLGIGIELGLGLGLRLR